MRNSQSFKSYPLTVVILLSLIIYFSCNKSDQSTTLINPVHLIDGYFKTDDSTDAIVTSIANALNRQNELNPFKEELIKNAGYAQWKFAKTLVHNSSSRSQNEDEVINIPFVKRGVNATSAILVVRVNSTDTIFELVYPQHYILYLMDDNSTDPEEQYSFTSVRTARDLFNVFSNFDFGMFGIENYIITDGRIFNREKNDTLTATVSHSNAVMETGAARAQHPDMASAAVMLVCNNVTVCRPASSKKNINASLASICTTTTNCVVAITNGGGDIPVNPGGGGSGGGGSGSGGNSGSGGGSGSILIPSTPCKRIANLIARQGDPCATQPWIPAFDSNLPFAHLETPFNAPPDVHIFSMDGITLSDVPDGAPTNMSKLIGRTNNRGHTEDMLSETNGNTLGIVTGMISKTDEQLFSDMDWLFYYCTYYNNGLKDVGTLMIQKFKDKTGGTFENPVLNTAVHDNVGMDTFFVKFGNKLRDEVTRVKGDINQVGIIEMGTTRPKFNSFYDKFHGLQILINDTEYTEIQLNDFYLDPTGAWSADVVVTIHDHFGLDKNDALTYQNQNLGFAAWWLLQHVRGYRPFETIVHVKRRINGFL